MIRRPALIVCIALLGAWLAHAAQVERLPLLDGSVLVGEPTSFNEQGVVVKKEDGSSTPRVPWTNFASIALQTLANYRPANPFVAPLLEIVDLELLNHSMLSGKPISFNGQGVVVKRKDGSFAPRVHWTNFTQTALKTLSHYPVAKPFVEPLIEEDVKLEPIPKTRSVTLKPVPRLDRPSPQAGLGSFFASPLSLAVIVLLYLANLYASYEVARYRNYHPGLVCGIAAVVPLIGPIIFLSLPTYFEEEIVEEEEQVAPQEPLTVSPRAAAAPEAERPAAAAPRASSGPPSPTVFKRPQVTFNRRFFETKMAAYLKVVPSEAEKDMVLCVASARGSFVASRITRIQPNGLTLLVKKGDASTDVEIPFSEINEVQIRHKEAAE